MKKCYFCNEIATSLNKDKISCCKKHKNNTAEEKCPLCGDELQKMSGKYGAFFKCIFCGVNYSEQKLKKYKN